MSSIMSKESLHDERDGSSAGGRGAKGQEDGDGDRRITLPPDVVAIIMEYLPYESILSCAATCRSFLHEALPSLRKLHIDKAAQMNLTVASRFRDVRSIQIDSLLSQRYDEDEGMRLIKVDFETSLRIVPFLSRFSQLERVTFGGKGEDGKVMDRFTPIRGYFHVDGEVEDEGDYERLISVVDSLSAAFRVGALPKTLQILGLICPRSAHHGTGSDCQTCLRACRSFPIASVLRFECTGSSREKAMSERSWPLDVCLERSKIEFILETRPGGSELLRSQERLLTLLGSGRRYMLGSGAGGQAFRIVKYTSRELEEMKRAIEYAGIDTKKLPKLDVAGAIMRSFTKDETGLLPPRNMCHLSQDSFDELKERLGICVDEENINSPIEDMVGILPQIAEMLLGVVYHDVRLDCLRLIRRMLEMEIPPIQTVLDLGLAPKLVPTLGGGTWTEKTRSLVAILTKGTQAQRKTVLDVDRLVRSICSGFYYSEASVIEVTVSALVQITKHGTDEHIESIKKVCAIVSRLVGTLKSHTENNVIIEGVLGLLVIAAKDCIDVATKAGALSHLGRILISSNKDGVLAKCSTLLRWSLDGPQPQEVIDFLLDDVGLVRRMAELLKTTRDETVQLNLAHVMINLMKGTAEQTKMLVEKEGILPRIVDSLMRSIKRTTDVGLLRTATSTLVQCCRGRPIKFSTSDVSVLSGLLANDDLSVVENCCWALCSMLSAFKDETVNAEDVNAMVDSGFVRPILDLLSNGSLHVLEPAVKAVRLITTMGDSCIESITSNDGLLRLKELLCRPHGLHEKIHTRACNAVSNIIAGDKERIQAAIDLGIVSSSIEMMSNVVFRVKRQALWVLYHATKGGTAAQIEYMVTQGCVPSFCSMLCEDANVSIIAIWALKNVLKVGKGLATIAEAVASNVETIESKLQEMMEENLRLESENERISLLKKKRNWLHYEQQLQYVNSLNDTYKLLGEQTVEMRKQLQSLEDKINAKRSMTQFCDSLRKKNNEMISIIACKRVAMKGDLDQATSKLDRFEKSAQERAPKEEWAERLNEDDIPADLAGVGEAIGSSANTVKEIEATRRSAQRQIDIDLVRMALKEMFKKKEPDVVSDDVAPNKRTRSDANDGAEGEDSGTAPAEIPDQNGENGRSTKPKKKKQRGIAAFFTKASGEN